MKTDNKRLKVFKALFLIKITGINEGDSIIKYYFRLRKWNPIIMIMMIHFIIRESFKEIRKIYKECIQDLNTEESIVMVKEDKK